MTHQSMGRNPTEAPAHARTCSSKVEVVPYRPDAECEQTYSLWERNFSERWPITLEIFREVTEGVQSRSETHQLVAKDPGGRIVGYLGSQIRPRKDTEASILLVMVEPDHQRCGFGTKLLNAALARFESEGIATVHLGAFADFPFWHGMPAYLPAAKRFFEVQGWEIYERSYDLLMDLRDYEPQDWVAERPRQTGIRIRGAEAEDVPALLHHLEKEFPDWYGWYVRELEERGTNDIIIARKGTQVVGSIRVWEVSSPHWTGRQWRVMLGQDMGALGVVAVREAERNKGIGLALVDAASRALRERGVRNCFVHWTWLVDWYGKLGYKVWQEYWMARKAIGEL